MTPVPDAPKAEGSLTLLDGETAATGVNYASLNKDTTYVKSGYEGGFLHLSVYVKNFDKLSGGCVELTSSGRADDQEMAWQIKTYIRNEGWNELWLPSA